MFQVMVACQRRLPDNSDLSSLNAVKYGPVELNKSYIFVAGMKDGQKLVFHGEGDQEPELEPGDIIIVLDQRVHPVFTR
jgi:hypothetical protein